jgi:hypothetical protein
MNTGRVFLVLFLALSGCSEERATRIRIDTPDGVNLVDKLAYDACLTGAQPSPYSRATACAAAAQQIGGKKGLEIASQACLDYREADACTAYIRIWTSSGERIDYLKDYINLSTRLCLENTAIKSRGGFDRTATICGYFARHAHHDRLAGDIYRNVCDMTGDRLTCEAAQNAGAHVDWGRAERARALVRRANNEAMTALRERAAIELAARQ